MTSRTSRVLAQFLGNHNKGEMGKENKVANHGDTMEVDGVNEFGFQEQNGEHSPYFEFIKGRLYYTFVEYALENTDKVYYFCIDDTLLYRSFAKDFGPLSMGMTYRFCANLQNLLKTEKRAICFYSNKTFPEKTNAAVLVCLFMILARGLDAIQAYAPFQENNTKFLPYRDAGAGPSLYNLELIDVLKGVHKAKELGWIDLKTFNLKEYEHFEAVQHGDWNWIVPGKFLAFATPKGSPRNYYELTPSYFVGHFKKMNINVVVRLNDKLYEENDFIKHGIQHYDMSYPDGHNPTDEILESFLEMSHQNQGGIAVHCMAGLGRTGTLICAYMIKHYGFTTAESIGYSRVCRPGFVVGPQQLYLEKFEANLRLYRPSPSKFMSLGLGLAKHATEQQGYTPQPRKLDGKSRGMESAPGVIACGV